MFFRKCRKIIAGAILGAGIGMLLFLVLPPRIWLFIIAIALIFVGIKKVCKKWGGKIWQ